MSKNNVEKIFDEFLVETLSQKPDVLRYIKGHERKKLVIENLCEEIIRAEQYNFNFNAEKYRYVIRSMAKTFGTVCLEHHRQSNLSQLEKIRIRNESEKLKTAQETLETIERESPEAQIKSFGGYNEQ